jgi:hypothetical protein
MFLLDRDSFAGYASICYFNYFLPSGISPLMIQASFWLFVTSSSGTNLVLSSWNIIKTDVYFRHK